MPDVVVCEFMDEAAVAELCRGRDVLYDPELVDRPEALLQAVTEARALIVRNRTQVRGALLDRAGRLQVVGRLGVGLDNIDLDACRARGIAVCPATGANDDSVAEYVICAAMMLLRRAYQSTAAVSAGDWPRNALMGREIAGKWLGLIGFGSIARNTARRAASLGMRIGAFDPYLSTGDPAWGAAERMDFDALLETADVVSLHVPLTAETRALIGPQALSRMKPDAVLINAARGGVVDEVALADGLRSGRIGGAALDVFADEPLTADRGRNFVGLANLILTPHIAGVTEEANARVSRLTVENVLRHLTPRA